jgi:hypothetical protein
MGKIGPVRIQILEGDPVQAGRYTLTPLVRAISYVGRSATVGQREVKGMGGGFVWLKPVAVIQEGPGGRCRVPIPDPTYRRLRWMLAVAVVLGVGLALAGRWAGQRRPAD